MLATVKSSNEIMHPNDDPEVRAATVCVLQADKLLKDAKSRWNDLQHALRESRDPVERSQAKLDATQLERDVLVLEREVELARRAEEEARKQVHARLLPHFKKLYGNALRKIQLMHKQVAAPAHAEARAIRNEALSYGVRLEICEWHEFGAQERGFTPKWLDWPRLVGLQGYWVDD